MKNSCQLYTVSTRTSTAADVVDTILPKPDEYNFNFIICFLTSAILNTIFLFRAKRGKCRQTNAHVCSRPERNCMYCTVFVIYCLLSNTFSTRPKHPTGCPNLQKLYHSFPSFFSERTVRISRFLFKPFLELQNPNYLPPPPPINILRSLLYNLHTLFC